MTTQLTTKDMATRCGVTNRQVQRWCKSGELPAQRIGRDWIISEDDARKFMAKRETDKSIDE